MHLYAVEVIRSVIRRVDAGEHPGVSILLAIDNLPRRLREKGECRLEIQVLFSLGRSGSIATHTGQQPRLGRLSLPRSVSPLGSRGHVEHSESGANHTLFDL
eukprot:CAMPEP_0175891706 /NCGR_PEP_ID=MMETSP0107_2-20121207/48524_1 /TAXON_ID=195067 ORGANISM="Goniomonas pacifica, Strain CCMP1869" /NCGR_SAMPLE_ID=MMETSP0107_2 /ASSEMBLY_ACC=CAM_ASM_000203 /LENGTH=101 /DNA_ID=CAMNT_0017212595 /DNA_START=233 /DNA_END=535 /DNA_ORIENTATION=-